MDKVNVLMLARAGLDEGYLESIAAVDNRILVRDGTGPLLAELHKKGAKGPLVLILEDDVRGQALKETEGIDELLAEAEVIFGVLFPDELLKRAPRLKWIHIAGTGIDDVLTSGIFDGKVVVTNSRGVVAIPIAEHVIGFMFMLAKDAPRLLENKQYKRWERLVATELRNKTVGLIGLGAIGGEVARLAKGIGMRVIATRRSAVVRESGVLGIDELYPPTDLLELLSASDFVVIAVPLTTDTTRMIGDAQLRAMKPTAYLINIARGRIIDQPLLIRALKEGWIAGAGLDAFDPEPLPKDSDLWELPNVILSPHSSGLTTMHNQRVLGMFCDNLRRYLAGEQLFNIIDKQKGY